MRAPVTQAVLICTLVGLLGGTILMALGLATMLTGVVVGGLSGAVFSMTATQLFRFPRLVKR